MMNLKFKAAAAFIAVAALPAMAATFTDQTAWRTAVGNAFVQDNFETYSQFTGLSGLPELGITFDSLTNNQLVTVRSVSQVGGTSGTGPNVILNGPFFPGNGAITVRPADPATALGGLGFFNTSGDDRVTLSFFSAAGGLLDTISTEAGLPQNLGFTGITASPGAAYATINAIDGNGWLSIDDLQVSLIAVPEPTSLGLFALAGMAVLARRPRA